MYLILCIHQAKSGSLSDGNEGIKSQGRKTFLCLTLKYLHPLIFFLAVITPNIWNTELWKHNENLRLLNRSGKFVGSS